MGLEDDYRALLVARHRTLGTHKRRGKKLSKVCAGQVSTLIGYGSPNKADTHDVHGAPLGKDETAATRENLKWNYGEFEVSPGFCTLDMAKENLPHSTSPYWDDRTQGSKGSIMASQVQGCLKR